MKTNEAIPSQLERGNGCLRIVWSDQVKHDLPLKFLRDACPCASCVETDSKATTNNPLQVLRPEQTRPLEIVAMKPVGNYAYNIEFSDGHSTGIYTFQLLRRLGGQASSDEDSK